MRALLNKIRRAFLSGTLISHYLVNKSFRVNISLLSGLILNLIYLVFNFVSGIKYVSPAFIAVSVYYALHICIRYTILNVFDCKKEKGNEELSACRKGGILLLIADVLITPMLIFGAFSDRTEKYSVPVLVFLGFYAAYNLINASVGIFMSKRNRVHVRRAAYSVKLASGAVSVLNLVSALGRTFSKNYLFSEMLTVILGILVSLFVLYLSLSMIFLREKRKGV